MPFQIIKVGDKYALKRRDGTVINKRFNSRQTAINTGKRWMEFRKEGRTKVVDNWIVRV